MSRLMKRFLVFFLCLMVFTPYVLSSEVSAGKLKPPGETFTPGEWFLGDRPPNYNSSKPPIVFVQGKNGSSTSWYGETTYHGVNDIYTKAYEAGYQTVFVQLYDAAGNGSENQYTNGRLLASMLGEISRHFNGQEVNIIAHSKGGPDTQAALIHYGAHSYVGRVITLGSPHYGSELADLSYSWYAGWLGELLGQNDPGTYSLQVGEMAKFRSATDSNSNRSKNKYYTVAGTNKGPALSALSLGEPIYLYTGQMMASLRRLAQSCHMAHIYLPTAQLIMIIFAKVPKFFLGLSLIYAVLPSVNWPLIANLQIKRIKLSIVNPPAILPEASCRIINLQKKKFMFLPKQVALSPSTQPAMIRLSS